MHNKPHSAETRAKMSASHSGKPRPWKHRPSVVVDGVTYWRCGTCHGYFSRDGYHKEKRTVLGIKTQCKTCHAKCSIRTRDPEKIRRRSTIYEGNRRARKANTGCFLSSSDWDRIIQILGRNCLRCGCGSNIQKDHIVPLSRGGMHHPLNMQPLCRRCNEVKQARDWDFRTPVQIAEIKKIWVYSTERVSS